MVYKERQETDRIPLVITWNHRIRGISKVIQSTYRSIVTQFPEFKKVFPVAPMVAYRRPKNLASFLVKDR